MDKLNALRQGTFRLPSEAEWEYCCRAGTTTHFHWGDDPNYTQIGDYAWYDNNAWNVNEEYAHVVGLKLPNAFGLYDMNGNVREWCEDWRNGNYQGAPNDGSAWTTGYFGSRVARGGHWFGEAYSCRSAYRYSSSPGGRDTLIGVRVVRNLHNQSPEADSIGIGSFSPSSVGQGSSVSNTGSVSGSGSGAIEYHWITRKPDGSYHDSGPLPAQMTNGAAAISAHTGFPTDQTGQYQSFIRVTSPSPVKESPNAGYTVTEGGRQEIIVNIPGLPRDAIPLTLVRFPAGSFMMGRYTGEQDGGADEDPRHRVDIGYDFYIGKYELTKAQWQALMGTTPWQGQSYVLNDQDSSAVYVSWNDIRHANGLFDKLNALGQGNFRLPSEAEWEYACRAGTTTRFYWGDDPDYTQVGHYAWYHENAYNVGEQYAHVVGLKLPNAFGMYDMNGNVSEWCEDRWSSSYQGAPTDGSARSISNYDTRVARGADWNDRASSCRSANRIYGYHRTYRFNFIGVRVVRTVGDPVPTPTPTPTPTVVYEDVTINLPGLPADATPLLMVKIPAGSFMMGRDPLEQDSYTAEEPQHQVNIGYDFYIGKYEFTQAQWQALMGTTPWLGRSHVLDDPNSPAVYVSWNDIHDVNSLLDKLNALGQGTFRLPSEAEWEYACRTGTTTRFYWGDDPNYTQIGDYTWYRENAWNTSEEYAHIVGLKLPNAFGLCDMSGNVWEWCEDSWNLNYEGAPTDGSAWTTGDARSRMIRGGDFDSAGMYCRSAYRPDYYADGRSYSIGVRVARTSDGPVGTPTPTPTATPTFTRTPTPT